MSKPSTAERSPHAPRYLSMLEADRRHWWRSENFDKWKSHYVGEYERGKYIIGTIREHVPAFDIGGASVLDVGCGDAGVLIAFAEAGARATGVEPNARSLKRGRVRAEEHGVHIDLRSGIAEELPFPDASFDLVMLDNVLEHVQDRWRTLREIHRVLRPGGLLYLVTPKPLALHSLVSDPHYGLAGLVLLPRPLQVFYFERLRGGGEGNYGVGVIPTRRSVLRMLHETGFESLVSSRELWIRYLRDRITRPDEVSTGLKRTLARWVARRPWLVESQVARAIWDVSLGSNFFIARRS